jgi:hypothetical protein
MKCISRLEFTSRKICPTGWTQLDMTYDGRNCLLLRFLVSSPTKEFQAPRYTRLLQVQIAIYRRTIKFVYSFRRLQGGWKLVLLYYWKLFLTFISPQF